MFFRYRKERYLFGIKSEIKKVVCVGIGFCRSS